MKILKIKIILTIIFLISFSYSYGQLVNDIKVNEDTILASKKYNSKISIGQNGNLAIVWANEYYNIKSANIYCQIFNYKLNRIGENFRVNSIPDSSVMPDVSIAKNGNIGIVFQTYNPTRIYFKLFNKDGIELTPDIQIIDTINADYDGFPAIAADDNNGFIIVFEYPPSTGGWDIYYQGIDSIGNKIGHNVNVSLIGSVYITSILSGPKIAIQKSGGFIITWTDHRPIAPTGDIYMQMFDRDGNRIGVNTRVNDPDFEPEDVQCAPQIAVDSSGGFTIAFDDTPYSSGVDGVKYQRFDKNGVKLGNNKSLSGIFYLKGLAEDERGNLVFSLNQVYASINFLYNLRIDNNDNIIGDFFPVSNQYISSLKVGEGIAMYNEKIYNCWGDFRIAGRNKYANVRSYWNPDSTVGINQIGTEVPVEYSLSQNYPNPFNPVTKINFAIPKQGFVTIRLYDILGREVSRLVNEYMTAGEYTIDFNAGNLSSGIYFYRMEINGFSDIKKMILIK